MNWVWTHSRSRHSARLTLLAIADCASGDGGNAWPSNRELQRKTNLTERGVRTAVAELILLGELAVDLKAGPGGCNRYRVLMATPAESAPGAKFAGGKVCPTPELTSSQANGHPPAESAPGAKFAGVQSLPHPPAKIAPGTVLEPKQNSPSESSGRRKRATRIPDDFTVTPAMAQWARDNCPELIRRGRGKRETEKFINHWHAASGRTATKHDWEAAWRNWMLKAEDDLEPARNGRAPTPTDPRREWETNRA